MKKILLIALAFPLLCKAQSDIRTAIVSKHNNIPVFIMSEPVKEYNVVGAVTDKFRTDTVDIQKNQPLTINDMVDRLLVYANELAIQGYTKGIFPEGSVLVFDVISAKESKGVIEESSRSVVDVMVKDSSKYAATDGWGFERFKGDSNTERILDANFRSACVNCHKKNKDFVFSEYRK